MQCILICYQTVFVRIKNTFFFACLMTQSIPEISSSIQIDCDVFADGSTVHWLDLSSFEHPLTRNMGICQAAVYVIINQGINLRQFLAKCFLDLMEVEDKKSSKSTSFILVDPLLICRTQCHLNFLLFRCCQNIFLVFHVENFAFMERTSLYEQAGAELGYTSVVSC